MIKNEKQYKITKSWLKKFMDGKKKMEGLSESKEQPWLRQAQSGSLRAQIDQFKEEIEEYEALKSGKIKVTLPSLEAITELPTLLIKRRISNGWTLEQLAKRLDMHWQQLQRYEQTDYASANLQTIQKVAVALSGGPGRPVRKKVRERSSTKRVVKRAKA